MPEDTQVVDAEVTENPDGLDPLRDEVQAARDELADVRAERAKAAAENESIETKKALEKELAALKAEIQYEEVARKLTERAGLTEADESKNVSSTTAAAKAETAKPSPAPALGGASTPPSAPAATAENKE